MKKIFGFIAIIISLNYLNAQDIITLKNGNNLNGSVIEITSTEVKFKKSTDGPLYTMNVSEIRTITFQNGNVENFDPTYVPPKQEKEAKVNEDEMIILTKKYGGPRIGMTYLSVGTNRTKIADAFNRADISPFISQFGWQFETRIFTLENGASGLFEFIPMIGGIEQGLFLPSATGVIGFRAANGVEFGVGPSASLSGFGLVMAVGASFKAGKITFPFNLAFSPNVKKMLPDNSVYNPNTGQYETVPGITTNSGFKLSLLIGFNSRKA